MSHLSLLPANPFHLRQVWEGQGETDLMGFWDLLESAQLNKQFSFAVEEDGWLVLRRRCAESSLKQE